MHREKGLSAITCRLAAAAILAGNAPVAQGSPRDAAPRAIPSDSLDQGIIGRFEVLAGTRPRDPGCGRLASPAARDSCERNSPPRTGGRHGRTLISSAVLVNAAGDSLVFALDSLGGFRAVVPPGVYTVCVHADRMPVPFPLHIRCQDKVEVEPGKFTSFIRVLPMP